jgi:hypothetical protein
LPKSGRSHFDLRAEERTIIERKRDFDRFREMQRSLGPVIPVITPR